MALQHLRSSTANKRPVATSLADGQLAINTNAASPGIFFTNSSNVLTKVGPIHIGTSAPNSSPSGSSGNAVGEQWLDTSGSTVVLKVWDGSAWQQQNKFAAVAGTAAAPSYSFSGDSNTGIYSPGANQVAISTNGTGRLFVDSSGKVGLGTISPSSVLEITSSSIESLLGVKAAATRNAYLDLDGDANRRAVIRFNSAGTAKWSIGRGDSDEISADSFHVSTGSSGGNAAKLVVTSSGNVGVGTTTPQAPLSISNGGANGIEIYSDYTGTGQSGIVSYNRSASQRTDLYISTDETIFATGGSERCRIDASGRLLLGTSSGRAAAGLTGQLLVEGTTYSQSTISAVANVSSESLGAFITLAKTRGSTIGSSTIVNVNDTCGDIRFAGADGTNLIHCASVSAQVDGTPGANDMPGRLVFSTTADGASSPTERMRITSAGVLQVADAGNIAVGTTTGTKIGTATSQKIGFFNATPVVQPTTGVAEATFVENSGGTAVNVDSTFGGYTLQQVVQALQNLGILA